MERIIKTEIESICGGKSCLENVKAYMFGMHNNAKIGKEKKNLIYMIRIAKNASAFKPVNSLCNLCIRFSCNEIAAYKETLK